MYNLMLGTRIKMLRERERMSRDELAKKIGVSYSAIAMYERGEREPDNEKLLNLANTFKVTTDYLLGKGKINLKDELESKLKRLYLDKYEFEMAIKAFKSDYFYIEYDDNVHDITNNRDNIEAAYEILNDTFSEYLVDKQGNFVKTYSELTEKEKKEIFDIIDSLDLNKFLRNQENIDYKKYYMCPVYGQISAGEPNWAEENIEGRLPIDTELMDIINPEEYFFLRVNGESMNNVVKNGAFALIHKQDIVKDGEIAVVLVNGYDATLKRFTKKGDVVVLEPDSSDSSFKTQIYDKSTPIKILGKYVGKMEINK